MGIPIRQSQDDCESGIGVRLSPLGFDQDGSDDWASAPAGAHDYYSVLLNVIAEASSDPARLRKLVYAMAYYNLKLDAVLADPIPDVTKQAKTVLQLEQALQLEFAIKRLESQFASMPSAPPSAGPPERPEPTDAAAPDRSPLGIADQNRFDAMADAPIPRPYAVRRRVPLFLQLCAATAAGLALVVGISGWFHLARPAATHTARASVPPALALAETVGHAQRRPVGPAAATRNALPFPLPVNYGVYAGSNSQLIELEPLPIDVPAPHVRMSAEITKASRVTVSGDKLAFVVFKQNGTTEIPATVMARVVARVTHATVFINLRARETALESSWRIRDKSYEFKVSPIEGNREMLLVQSDVVLPAGRYALVLNGSGYDFTVAGPITAPEQCLQQAQMVSGVVLAECRRS